MHPKYHLILHCLTEMENMKKKEKKRNSIKTNITLEL